MKKSTALHIYIIIVVMASIQTASANSNNMKQACSTSSHLSKFAQDTIRKQYYNFEHDTYSVNPQQKEERRKRSFFRGHWVGGYAGINSYVTKDLSLDLEDDQQFMEINSSKSWSFAANFAQYSIPIINKHLGMVLGLGAEWNNYNFKYNNTITVDEGTEMIIPLPIDSTIVGKNRLQTMYATSGALIEFHVNGNYGRPMSIAAGVVGGMRIYANTSHKIEFGGEKKKVREGGEFNLQDFRYHYTARIGFGCIGAYINYSPMPLFKVDSGPELYPVTLGFVLYIE